MDFHGNSVALGFAIGILYELDASSRLGLSYRSRLHHTIDGMQTVSVPTAVSIAAPSIARAFSTSAGPAGSAVTLPDSLSVGLFKQLDDRWSIMAEIQWTNWSTINTLAIMPANGSPGTVLREGWRDTWFGAIGVGFQVNERTLLQAGIGYDFSPVTNSSRTTRVPDADRLLVGIGLTYSLLENVELQVAALEAIGGTASIINSATASAGTILGTYSSHATVVGLGVAVRF